MDIYVLDTTALRDLLPIVAALTDADLTAPTPCDGWLVRDLLEHMNSQHEAISSSLVDEPITLDPDPRKAFGQAASRWISALGVAFAADRPVRVPSFDTELPVRSLLSVHFIDMLVHRWDLAKSLGVPADLPDELVVVALPIALGVPDSGPLRGPNGYAAQVDIENPAPPADQLVAALGRSPGWRPR